MSTHDDKEFLPYPEMDSVLGYQEKRRIMHPPLGEAKSLSVMNAARNWTVEESEKANHMNDIFKKVLGFAGVVAGGLLGVLPPHTLAWKVSAAVAGLLAGGGIVSTGVTKKQ